MYIFIQFKEESKTKVMYSALIFFEVPCVTYFASPSPCARGNTSILIFFLLFIPLLVFIIIILMHVS